MDAAVVWRGRDDRQCSELSLVLTARGIEHARAFDGGDWVLVTARADAGVAASEIAAYTRERTRPPEPPPPPLAHHPQAPLGVALYAAVLMLVAVFANQAWLGIDWRNAGMLIAGAVRSGEVWRTVTALTLHGDAGHLLSNLGFGGFFGYFIGRYFGPGVGWFAILMSGAAGNWLNAAIQSAGHRSIGASTAVFGALGLLTAYTWRRGTKQGNRRARYAPIVAGIALLAFTGTGGENTDVLAHLTGFIAGFAIGAVLTRVGWPNSRRAQWGFGAAGAAVLGLSWLAAVVRAG